MGCTVSNLIRECKNNDTRSALRKLHNKKFMYETTEFWNMNCLMYACFNKMENVALEIIKTCNINYGELTYFNHTTLMYACKYNMENVALAILEKCTCNVGYINKIYESTSLIIACMMNMEQVVKRLLMLDNINVNNQDINGTSALIMCSAHMSEDMVILMLNYNGIDITVKDVFGRDVMYYAKRKQYNRVIYLLNKKIDI